MHSKKQQSQRTTVLSDSYRNVLNAKQKVQNASVSPNILHDVQKTKLQSLATILCSGNGRPEIFSTYNRTQHSLTSVFDLFRPPGSWTNLFSECLIATIEIRTSVNGCRIRFKFIVFFLRTSNYWLTRFHYMFVSLQKHRLPTALYVLLTSTLPYPHSFWSSHLYFHSYPTFVQLLPHDGNAVDFAVSDQGVCTHLW